MCIWGSEESQVIYHKIFGNDISRKVVNYILG
jgi:hypothetical protein